MSGEQPADPYCHRKLREGQRVQPTYGALERSNRMLRAVIAIHEAEIARLNMEMEAYRPKLTNADAAAISAVIKALEDEKAARQEPALPGDGEA